MILEPATRPLNKAFDHWFEIMVQYHGSLPASSIEDTVLSIFKAREREAPTATPDTLSHAVLINATLTPEHSSSTGVYLVEKTKAGTYNFGRPM